MIFDVSELLVAIRLNAIVSLDLYQERLAKAKDFQPAATLLGHTSDVWALAVLSDKRIVSGSADKILRIWDATTHQCIATLKGHTDWVKALAVLPDGRIVSGSYDKTLRIWDAATHQCITTLKGHTSCVYSLAVLPDGRIISSSYDTTLRIWDAATHQCIATLQGYTEGVHVLAVLPDGCIVSGSEGKTLRLWDATTHQAISTLKGHTKSVRALTVLPDGRLVSGSIDNTLRLWNANTHHCLATLQGHTSAVSALAILPDGRIVSGSWDNTLRLWDATTHQCISTLKGHNSYVYALAVLPDGRIVSGSRDGTLRLWEGGLPVLALADANRLINALTSNTSLKSLSFARSNLKLAQVQAIADLLKVNATLTSLDLSENVINDAGAQILIEALTVNKALTALNLTGNVIHNEDKKTINTLLARNQKSSASPLSALSTKDEAMLFDVSEFLTAIRNNAIASLDLYQERLAKAKDFQFTATFKGHTDAVTALLVLPDGRMVSGSHDKTLRIWDANTHQCIATLKGHTSAVRALAVLPDGRIVSSSQDKTLRLWDATTHQCIATLNGHTRVVIALTVLPDGRIVSGSYDSTLRLWNANTHHCLATLQGHTEAVMALAALPDGRIVSGSYDSTLRLWDANTHHCLATLQGHTEAVMALAVLPNGRIVSGSSDKTLRLWDATTHQCIAILQGHTKGVWTLAVLPNGHIISGSADKTLRLWDANTHHCLATLQGHTEAVMALAVLPDGRIVSGSDDNTLCLWEGGVPALAPADFDKMLGALKANASIHFLNLSRMTFNLKQVQAIADLLKVNNALTSLDLSYNGINDAGAKLLADALQVNNALKILNVSNNPISAPLLKAIKDGLAQKQAKVYTLPAVTPLQSPASIPMPAPALIGLPSPISAASLSASSPVLKPLPKPASVKAKPVLEHATTLYAYQAEESNELSVPENATIDILTKHDSGWWLCQYQHKEGLVPSTFLTQASPSTATHKPLPSSPKIAATKASELLSPPIAITASATSSTNALTTTASSIPLALTIPHKDIAYDDSTKPIGKGAFGEVFKGIWRHEPVAIKRLLNTHLSPAVETDFKNEAAIMAQLRSDYIITLKGIVLDTQPFCLVMSWAAKGSLYDILHSDEDLPWVLRQRIAWDISKGLSFLHHEKILHRDLKSLNVLLDEHIRAKLTDFGLSKMKIETKSKSSKAESSKGTTRWKAPEIFGLKPQYSEKSDIYAYAMVTWELATRKIPYAEVDDDAEIRDAVKSGEREEIPADCPPAIAQLIERCWKQKPEARPTAHEVVEYLAKAPTVKEQAPASIAAKQKSWQVDPRIKPASATYTISSQFLEPTEEDKQKVISYYQQYPVPGCDIGRIQVIYSSGVDDEFELRLRKLQKRAGKQAFEPKWADESNTPEEKTWRAKIYGQFKLVTEPFADSDYPNVKLIPVWHGTKKAIVPSILETGYANLATTDPGFFGKGLYSACEAEYSYRVYASGVKGQSYASEEGVLLLNWVSAYSAYPVIESDMSKLMGKGNYGNHDTHIVPVAPKNPNNPFEVNYLPCKPNQPAQYTEIVVFDSAHCLPRYLVELQPTLPKPMPTPAAYLQIQKARHSTFFKQEGINFKDKGAASSAKAGLKK